MAEAALDCISTRYFCHACSTSVDISPNILDLTCPKCNGGFIEELTQELAEGNLPSTNTSISQDYITTLFSAINFPSSNTRQNFSTDSSDDDNHSLDLTPRRNNLIGRNRPDTPIDRGLPRFLESIFLSLGSNEPNWISNIFNSNVEDYVWGDNGLDNIITQLLNQMDGPSPPPASDADIENLENVIVDDLFLEKERQCSICMEAFNLMDNIKRLPCIHFFHTECILPWLKLHGTCPICRQIIKSINLSDKPTQTVDNNSPSNSFYFNFLEDPNNENDANNDVNLQSDNEDEVDYVRKYDSEKNDSEKMDGDDGDNLNIFY